MVKVGCVNIDTSHPMGFAEAMQKTNRAKYVAVYNDSFRAKEEVEGFANRFNVENICETLEEMANLCDIVFIQGCNWDDHMRCAKPFIEKNIPVFIDKPIVGNLNDCEKVLEYVKEGAVIIGASAARYAYEIQEFLSMPVSQRGEVVSVQISCGVDDFNYGCHTVEAIGALLGEGAKSVKYIGKCQTDDIYTESSFVQFNNNTGAIFTTATGHWLPFDVLIFTTKGAYPIRLDSSKLYDALIEQICNYMQNKENIIVNTNAIVESVKISLCMAASREKNGKQIALCELTQDMPSFNGTEFYKKYSNAAGKMYAI